MKNYYNIMRKEIDNFELTIELLRTKFIILFIFILHTSKKEKYEKLQV